jgi:hypothetical protein
MPWFVVASSLWLDIGAQRRHYSKLAMIRGQLRGLRRRNVLNAGDVQDGTFDIFLAERSGVQVNAYLDGIPFDERHVVIGDGE